MPAERWISLKRRIVALGPPGSGKSTLLRFVALDLLSDAPRWPHLASRLGTFLPVWLPFAFLCEALEEIGAGASIGDALKAWLRRYDEGRLWPLVAQAIDDDRLLLLIDGLDEGADDDAAALAWDRLQVFADQRGVPVIASGRPAALRRLGPLSPDWTEGTLAGLSVEQQRQLIARALPPDEDDAGDRLRLEADRFVDELQAEADLRDLAQVPLLLTLLLWLQRRDARLPNDRFQAYDEVIGYMLEQHPARRGRAAGVRPRPTALSVEETRRALGALAHRLHVGGGDGTSSLEAARATVAQHLADPDRGLGLDERDASGRARQVMEDAIRHFALLVEPAAGSVMFFHRSLQEHLTAQHLAGEPFDGQLERIAESATDGRWREVILNLLYLTRRRDDADRLVQEVRAQATDTAARWRLAPLLAEIGADQVGCSSSLARTLLSEAVDQVDIGEYQPVRQAVLSRVLRGLDRVGAREQVEAAVRRWLPGQEPWRASLLAAMRDWPVDPDADDVLWRALFDEDVGAARAAAAAFAHRCAGDPVWERRIRAALDSPVEADVRAALLQTLAVGWPESRQLGEQLAAATRSVHPDLRVVAHLARVRRGEHEAGDLEDLLLLGARFNDVSFARASDVGSALAEGFPNDERLRKACLTAARSGGPANGELDDDLAGWVLLERFAEHPDTISWVISELRREYPFLGGHLTVWRQLGQRLRGNERVAEELDHWYVSQSHHHLAEASLAAGVGRTAVARERLLRAVQEREWPVFWAVTALLDGWRDDNEVMAALRELAFADDSRAASEAARDLPEILGRTPLCAQRLLELLVEPRVRSGFVVVGLGRLERPELAGEVLARVGPHLLAEGRDEDELREALMAAYPGNERVRHLALELAALPGVTLTGVARSLGADPETRALLRRAAAPLPSVLRTQVADRLAEGGGDDALALELLSRFVGDGQPQSATALAVGYARRVRALPSARRASHEEVAVRHGRYALRGPAIDHLGANQAGLALLLSLDRVDVFATANWGRPPRPLDVDVTSHSTPNLRLAQVLAARWHEIQAVLGDSAPERLSLSWQAGVWELLAEVGATYPAAREALLDYIESGVGDDPVLLRFLSQARPGTALLRRHLLDAINFGVLTKGDGRRFAVACDLLVEHFAGDDAVASALAERDDAPHELLVVPLVEGWPARRETQLIRDAVDMRPGHRVALPVDLYARVHLAVSEAPAALAALRHMLGHFEIDSRYWSPPVPSLLRRLRADDAFADVVAQRLQEEPTCSEVASYPRLLAIARGLTVEQRAWCEQQLARTLDGDRVDAIGLDLLHMRVRPVGHALLEALAEAAT